MKPELRQTLETEEALRHVAAQIARRVSLPIKIYLSGDLAAGKTCFARGYIQALGHTGAVKSPTFTLVESYQLASRIVHHFDLYRISDAEELDYIGIEEYFNDDCLIEWPSKGAGELPQADIEIELIVVGRSREMRLSARNKYAEELVRDLAFKS